MAWLALFPGRLLERMGNHAPRGMTVHDRTRLTGQLLFFLVSLTAFYATPVHNCDFPEMHHDALHKLHSIDFVSI